jgi:hypothetical protein
MTEADGATNCLVDGAHSRRGLVEGRGEIATATSQRSHVEGVIGEHGRVGVGREAVVVVPVENV